MKKIILGISLIFVSISSFAQTANTLVASGTITNTTYSYKGYTLGTGVGGNVLYQIVATRVSGTTTGGIRLEYSNDGVNYVAIPNADTLAITNVATAQTKTIPIAIPAAKFVRVRGQLAGTGVYNYALYANYRYTAKP
jgi:hypothetical protein